MPDHEQCLIRPASPGDLEALVALCAEHAAYEGTFYDLRDKGEQLSAALFSPSPRLCAWVVEQQGRLVEYATATQEFSAWDAVVFVHMDCLYLREEVRGGGLGRLLMMEIAYLALTLGCIQVQWQAPAWNERAIRFYWRLGAEGKEKVRFCLPTDAFKTLLT